MAMMPPRPRRHRVSPLVGIVFLGVMSMAAVGGLIWMTLLGGFGWMTGHIEAASGHVERNFPLALLAFGVIAFLIQLVALPGGTVAVLSAGFLFGAPAAAFAYYLAQLSAAPVVFGATRLGIGERSDAAIYRLVRRRLPPALAATLSRARGEAVLAVIVMRLAPVLTSTFVPALAAILGLRLAHLMIGSALVSWIKPSITASVGAAARNLAEVTDPSQALAKLDPAPLLMIFAGAIGLLVVRIVLRQRPRA